MKPIVIFLQELYDNFYYIWAKLKNNDEECKDVEWKRCGQGPHRCRMLRNSSAHG